MTHQHRSFVSSTRLNMASFTAADISNSLSNKDHVGNDVFGAMYSLATADCVCFDVDSTVIQEEGIDVLAAYLGYGERVAALTKQAMEGGMKFQDALKARLDLLTPSKLQIESCLDEHPLKLSPGVAEFIQALQDANKAVYLVSGGFRLMIEPVAEILNIPKTNIVANTLLFDSDGFYYEFDKSEPTSQDMGKPKAIQSIMQTGHFKNVVMIGDGATDAQAKPPASAFIGFGGVARREKVVAASDWFVTDFEDMTRIVRDFGSK